MHPAKRWWWWGIGRPWWVLVSALAAAAVIIAIGALSLLRAEQHVLGDLRRDIRHIENALGQHRRTMAELPTRTQLEERISSINRQVAASETAHREPAVFVKSIDPGLSGTVAWRSSPGSRDGRVDSRRWTVAVTTDYPGLRRLLNRVAGLSGGLSLASFAVVTRDGRLDIEFELAETLLEEAHDK